MTVLDQLKLKLENLPQDEVYWGGLDGKFKGLLCAYPDGGHAIKLDFLNEAAGIWITTSMLITHELGTSESIGIANEILAEMRNQMRQHFIKNALAYFQANPKAWGDASGIRQSMDRARARAAKRASRA